MQSIIGQLPGCFHIPQQPSEGGMAIVYKDYDTRLEIDMSVGVTWRGAFFPRPTGAHPDSSGEPKSQVPDL